MTLHPMRPATALLALPGLGLDTFAQRAKDTLVLGMVLEPSPGLDPTTGAAAVVAGGGDNPSLERQRYFLGQVHMLRKTHESPSLGVHLRKPHVTAYLHPGN